MLLQLHPDKVSKMWDEIKPAIYESLPPFTGEREEIMNNILTAVLTEQLECWMSYQVVDDVNVMDAFLTTTFIYDDISKAKNILIYSLYGYHEISEQSWDEGFEALYKYGFSKGCSNIIAYTSNDYMIKRTVQFKGTSNHILSIPIGG